MRDLADGPFPAGRRFALMLRFRHGVKWLFAGDHGKLPAARFARGCWLNARNSVSDCQIVDRRTGLEVS